MTSGRFSFLPKVYKEPGEARLSQLQVKIERRRLIRISIVFEMQRSQKQTRHLQEAGRKAQEIRKKRKRVVLESNTP